MRAEASGTLYVTVPFIRVGFLFISCHLKVEAVISVTEPKKKKKENPKVFTGQEWMRSADVPLGVTKSRFKGHIFLPGFATF